MKFYRGKLLDHINLKVRDISRSRDFYKSIIEALGHTLTSEEKLYFTIDELVVSEDQHASQCIHLAFQAPSPASVKLFYKTALQHGGRCNGEPEERGRHMGQYSAFVLDPDGNNIEVIYQSPLARPATQIEMFHPRDASA